MENDKSLAARGGNAAGTAVDLGRFGVPAVMTMLATSVDDDPAEVVRVECGNTRRGMSYIERGEDYRVAYRRDSEVSEFW
jgi:hypothetical protein